jgi:hypothetical protein
MGGNKGDQLMFVEFKQEIDGSISEGEIEKWVESLKEPFVFDVCKTHFGRIRSAGFLKCDPATGVVYWGNYKEDLNFGTIAIYDILCIDKHEKGMVAYTIHMKDCD